MKSKKIGMRTIKTVIAVILTLIISEIFKLRSPLLASIAAIMTMESSVSESFTTGKNRMYGTILGGVIALGISLIFPSNFFSIGLGLIILISICNALKWDKASRMSMVVFLGILLNYKDGDRFDYAFHRTLDTLIGVVVGTSINYFIRPPRIEENIKKTTENMRCEVRNILEKLIWKGEVDNLERLKSEISHIEVNYRMLMDDMRFHLGMDENIIYYQNLFNSFEDIRNHLRVMKSIKELPRIDERNKKYLERYFNKEIPQQDDGEEDELDLIYNYHLERILSELSYIEDILEEIGYENMENCS